VQLRGYRIELGEVEAAVESLDGVARAVACLEDRPRMSLPALVCYLVPEPGVRPVTARQLITEVGWLLPPQAVPQIIRLVTYLPMTSNGKVDVKALQAAATPHR
jgi:acyl-coenzyme A synthetase/AMP-(fatty) acid ligase